MSSFLRIRRKLLAAKGKLNATIGGWSPPDIFLAILTPDVREGFLLRLEACWLLILRVFLKSACGLIPGYVNGNTVLPPPFESR